MKCLINDDNEITAFWEVDATAPLEALTCDAVYPITSCMNNDGSIDHFYTLSNGVVSVTQAGTTYLTKQYARNRAEAYPSLTEQADMAYWDRQNGTTTLDDAITAVKQKFPK